MANFIAFAEVAVQDGQQFAQQPQPPPRAGMCDAPGLRPDLLFFAEHDNISSFLLFFIGSKTASLNNPCIE